MITEFELLSHADQYTFIERHIMRNVSAYDNFEYDGEELKVFLDDLLIESYQFEELALLFEDYLIQQEMTMKKIS